MVNIDYFLSGIFPFDFVHLPLSFFAQLLIDSRISDYRINGIGHSIDIPIVGLNDIGQNLGTPRLLRNNRRHTHLNGSETEGITYTSLAFNIS